MLPMPSSSLSAITARAGNSISRYLEKEKKFQKNTKLLSKKSNNLLLSFTHPIISGNSSITVRPKSPGDLTYLDTDYTVVPTTNSLTIL